MAKEKVLVADDEAGARFGIRDFLELQGYEVDEADSCRETLEIFQTPRPDAAVIDYMLPDGNALDLLPRLKEIDATAPLIVLTAYGSIELAVRAVKEGAEHFLTKPVELQALLVILRRLLEDRRTRHRQLAGKSRRAREDVDPFFGTSAAIRQLAEQARRVVSTESPILLQGETGTGKGVLAKWLHDHGPRAEEGFVDLNCAGLSQDLLESELFGYAKGAFTGAVTNKTGLLEVAHRGSVFLDEIGDMEPQVQPKLLKVLEEKRLRRLGDVHDRYVDIRLIAATHHDLGLLVREKNFAVTSTTGSAPSPSSSLPCATGLGIFRGSPNICSEGWRPIWGAAMLAWTPMPNRRCRPIPGPATSESSATSWSEPCCSATGRSSAARICAST
jgi:DNA-binding NtrC family response regulator